MKSLFLFICCIFAAAVDVKAISGGENAKPHSAPFIVNLRRQGAKDIHCHGVIIKSNIILTTSSCVLNDIKEIIITAGDHNVRITEASEQKRSVIKAIKHPLSVDMYHPNNIAVVYVNIPFDFNEFVQPIVLPEIDQCFNGETIAYGWGWIDNMNFPDVLQTYQSKIIDRNLCKENVMIDFRLASTNICTWEEGKLKAMNIRDEGGPVIQMNKVGKPYLVGLLGFVGYPNVFISAPSVFGNVATMREFIDETIKTN